MPTNFNENCARFCQILAEFNAVHSLSNYDDFKEQIDDSLAGLDYVLNDGNFAPKTAIDVGSGAGFPGFILAMVTPEISWHLFEPNPKKSAFLTYAKLNLELKNIKIHRAKIENEPKFHADLITSRALGKIDFLLKICAGFFDEKSKFLLYKGSTAKDEFAKFNAQIYNGKNNRNYVVLKGIKCSL